MMSVAKFIKWLDAALTDGWIIEQDGIMKSGRDMPKFRHVILNKKGFSASLFIAKSGGRYSNLSIQNQQGARFDFPHLNQSEGYNWDSISQLDNACAHCFEQKDKSIVLNFIGICPDCDIKIKDFVKNQKPTPPREYIGKASVELRHVYGERNQQKVVGYRICASIEGKSYWEPYSGKRKVAAYDIYFAVIMALNCAGYEVAQKERKTTFNGQDLTLA